MVKRGHRGNREEEEEEDGQEHEEEKHGDVDSKERGLKDGTRGRRLRYVSSTGKSVAKRCADARPLHFNGELHLSEKPKTLGGLRR